MIAQPINAPKLPFVEVAKHMNLNPPAPVVRHYNDKDLSELRYNCKTQTGLEKMINYIREKVKVPNNLDLYSCYSRNLEKDNIKGHILYNIMFTIENNGTEKLILTQMKDGNAITFEDTHADGKITTTKDTISGHNNEQHIQFKYQLDNQENYILTICPLGENYREKTQKEIYPAGEKNTQKLKNTFCLKYKEIIKEVYDILNKENTFPKDLQLSIEKLFSL